MNTTPASSGSTIQNHKHTCTHARTHTARMNQHKHRSCIWSTNYALAALCKGHREEVVSLGWVHKASQFDTQNRGSQSQQLHTKHQLKPLSPYLSILPYLTISNSICSIIHQADFFWFLFLIFYFITVFVPYLVVQRSRRQTTWNCTVLLMTQIPWGAGEGWASWASTPGCQRGERCPRCTPTATDRRAPGGQTCPQCARPCAAEHPQSNPCSVWWSPQRSLAQAWWSGQKVPHRLAAWGRKEEFQVSTLCTFVGEETQPKNTWTFTPRDPLGKGFKFCLCYLSPHKIKHSILNLKKRYHCQETSGLLIDKQNGLSENRAFVDSVFLLLQN